MSLIFLSYTGNLQVILQTTLDIVKPIDIYVHVFIHVNASWGFANIQGREIQTLN